MRCLEINISYLLIFSLLSLVVTGLPADNKNYGELSNNATTRVKRSDTISKQQAGTILALILYTMCFDPPDDRNKIGCKVNVKNLHKNFPLIIDPNNNTKFLYPDDQGYIKFAHDDPVLLSCSVGNGIHFVKLPQEESHIFTCDCGKLFADGTTKYDFEDLVCTDTPKSIVIESYLTTMYRSYQIGFYTNAKQDFLNLIDVFYDEVMIKMPMYVRSKISSHKLGGQQTKFGKGFDPAEYYYPEIDSYYDEDKQIESFQWQLRTREDLAPEYLKKKSKEGYIFNRGHLTPKSSMVYSAAAKATFYHLNVAPQWLGINGQNWARIENYAVELATQLKRDLIVITGIHKQLQLPNADGVLTDVYLYYNNDPDEPDNLRIPIPKYMYKIIIDLENVEGVVYVTVNNPYMNWAEGPNNELCKQAIYRQDGLRGPPQWNPKNVVQGWSYMCEVHDFLTTTGLSLEGTEADMVTYQDVVENMKLLKMDPRCGRNDPGPSCSKP